MLTGRKILVGYVLGETAVEIFEQVLLMIVCNGCMLVMFVCVVVYRYTDIRAYRSPTPGNAFH